MSDKIGKFVVIGLGAVVVATSTYIAKITSDHREKKRKRALDKEFAAIDKKIMQQKKMQAKS